MAREREKKICDICTALSLNEPLVSWNKVQKWFFLNWANFFNDFLKLDINFFFTHTHTHTHTHTQKKGSYRLYITCLLNLEKYQVNYSAFFIIKQWGKKRNIQLKLTNKEKYK